MVSKTFSARVANGRLLYEESLAAFEGHPVRVTLTAESLPEAACEPREEPPAKNGEPALPNPETSANGDLDPEPPEDLDIEKDIYVRMPRRTERLTNVIVREGGRMRPCIIVPEELPDD